MAQTLNIRKLIKYRKSLFTRWHYIAIGVSGMLPDIVHPHLGLEARYSSWSHTIWFAAGSLATSLIASHFLPKRHKTAAYLCGIAVLLHIICDLISGGINPLPPYSDIIGDYWIPPQIWLFTDLFSIISIYTLSAITRYKLKRASTSC